MWKKVVTVLLVLSMLLALSACGSSANSAANSTVGGGTNSGNQAEEPVEVIFHHCKVEVKDGFEELAKVFNETHPEYRVVMELHDTGTLAEMFATGNPPDMVYTLGYSELQLAEFLKNDKLLPVDDLELFDVVSPSFKEGITFSDGHIYGAPILSCGKGIMYNKELFEKAGITQLPTTSDELWAACDKLEAIGVTPFVGGHQEAWTMHENLWRIFFSQYADPSFIQDRIDGKVKFADEIIPAWTEWIDNYTKYSSPDMLQINWATALGELFSENAAMIINGPWTIQSINEMDPAVGAKFGMFGMCSTDDPAKNVIVEDVDTIMLLVNSGDEAKIEACKAFLNWVDTSEEGRSIIANSIKCPNPIGVEFEGTGVDADIMKASTEGNTIFATTGLNVPAGWAQEVTVQTQKYIMGEITAEELGTKVDELWDSMYAG